MASSFCLMGTEYKRSSSRKCPTHRASISSPWAAQSQETLPYRVEHAPEALRITALLPRVSAKHDHRGRAIDWQTATLRAPRTAHGLTLRGAVSCPTLPLWHVHCKPRLNPQVRLLHADSAHCSLDSPVQLPLRPAGSLLPLHTPHLRPLCLPWVSSHLPFPRVPREAPSPPLCIADPSYAPPPTPTELKMQEPEPAMNEGSPTQRLRTSHTASESDQYKPGN